MGANWKPSFTELPAARLTRPCCAAADQVFSGRGCAARHRIAWHPAVLTFENTAITTLRPRSSGRARDGDAASHAHSPADAGATRAPTAAPTTAPAAAPTQAPTGGAAAGASFAQVQAILKAKCGACHGDTAMGGLNVGAFASLMKGRERPGLIAKDAEAVPW